MGYMKSEDKILNVPTNIITGFLGSGKTTAILNLLKNKPEGEKWAVLVNEFGEIGIDGSIFEGHQSEEQGVFIREVPGGCMCCTAGLSMEIALNILLSQARPDRLLIEPTGLGHPIEVLDVLSGEHYQGVLSIQKVITLIDARKLSDSRYINNDIFNQQVAVADVIVGNKADLYKNDDKDKLESYVNKQGADHVEVVITEQAVIDPDWLKGATETSITQQNTSHYKHSHDQKIKTTAADMTKAENTRGEFQSSGWRFTPHQVFDRSMLTDFFYTLNVERLKGVFITHEGIFTYNLTTDCLTEIELDECAESRVEIIHSEIASSWEAQLMKCITTN